MKTKLTFKAYDDKGEVVKGFRSSRPSFNYDRLEQIVDDVAQKTNPEADLLRLEDCEECQHSLNGRWASFVSYTAYYSDGKRYKFMLSFIQPTSQELAV